MPDALHDLAAGFCELAALVAVTLGPRRGPIWNAHNGDVELVSQSGILARRVVEIPGRVRNSGAMQLRHLVWRMQEHIGDGGAIAAVLAGAMVRDGEKLIAAGIDPLALRDGLRSALDCAMCALEQQRLPREFPDAMGRLVATVLDDPEIATIVGEMFDILGSEAAIHLEVMSRPWLDRQYVDGSFWKAQPVARTMIPTGKDELVLEQPVFLVTDDEVLEVQDLVPVLELVAHDGARRPLVIVGAKMGERSLEFLRLNSSRGMVAVSATSPNAVGAMRHQVLQDIAEVTGAELVSRTRGYSPANVRQTWLGTAGRAILTKESITIVDGGGDRMRRNDRAALLREQLTHALPGEDAVALRERLSSLVGGVGILQIGGLTQAERDDKRRLVERALRILPGLIEDGLVPGGGIAYVQCVRDVERFRSTLGTSDQRFGVDLLIRALDEPFLQLVRNEGRMTPAVVLDRVRNSPPGTGFNASSGTLEPMVEAGIVDSLAVLRGALRMAVSAAGELLTIGAVVLPREEKRDVRVDP